MGDPEGADDVDVEHLATEGDRRFECRNVGGNVGRIDHAVDAAERPPAMAIAFSVAGSLVTSRAWVNRRCGSAMPAARLANSVRSRSMAATFPPAGAAAQRLRTRGPALRR